MQLNRFIYFVLFDCLNVNYVNRIYIYSNFYNEKEIN